MTSGSVNFDFNCPSKEVLRPFLLNAKETITQIINKNRVQVNATKAVKFI